MSSAKALCIFACACLFAFSLEGKQAIVSKQAVSHGAVGDSSHGTENFDRHPT